MFPWYINCIDSKRHCTRGGKQDDLSLTSPSSGLLAQRALRPPIVLLVLSLKNPQALIYVVWSWAKTLHHLPEPSDTFCSPGSPASSSYTDSETLPACSPHNQHMWEAGPPGEGGLCSGLNHCGRSFFTLLAVINSGILSLHTADFEGEICPWPTASEPVWDSRGLVRSCIDQELWRLAGLLHIPVQKIISISILNTLTGSAGDGCHLSRDDRQGAWSLGQNNSPIGS